MGFPVVVEAARLVAPQIKGTDIVIQLAIKSGKLLFQVDYQDPDFDNFYFNENIVDNNNKEVKYQ